MAPAHAFPRTLDVASLAAPDQNPHQAGRLRSMLEQLASCDMGRRLLNVAIDHRLTFRFATGRELRDSRGQFGGFYHPDRNMISLEENADFDWQVKSLAHELQHFVDHMYGWPGLTVQAEVRARQTEALVIRQLRLRTSSWALEPNRELRMPSEVAARIRRDPLYRINTEEPPRFDGRIHPLLDAHEVFPPSVVPQRAASGGMRVNSVTPVAITSSIAAVGAVSTSPVSQAASAALGARNPTGWDASSAHPLDANVERFLQSLDARRLAMGA